MNKFLMIILENTQKKEPSIRTAQGFSIYLTPCTGVPASARTGQSCIVSSN
jgi:hypothetical protein